MKNIMKNKTFIFKLIDVGNKDFSIDKSWYFFFNYFIIIIIIIIVLLFKYSCLHFLPTTPPHPSHPHLPPSILAPFGFVHVSFIYALDGPTPISSYYPPPSLWLLSVYSLFQCLWLYFPCLFVLLIRSHLQVRSYGICLSLPGLFHSA